jgi:hypothetical protein
VHENGRGSALRRVSVIFIIVANGLSSHATVWFQSLQVPG